MNIKELREKTDAQLANLLKEHQSSLRDLRFGIRNGQLKQVSKVGQTKKTIAQILTIQHQRAQQSTQENA